MLVLTARRDVALELRLADGSTIRLLFSDFTRHKVKVAIAAPDEVIVKRVERPEVRRELPA